MADAVAGVADGPATDPVPEDALVRHARPYFLYVMYLLLLASIPLGILAAFAPATASAVVRGMTGYFAAIPEPLYALFGTGYIGYTVARQFGKAQPAAR